MCDSDCTAFRDLSEQQRREAVKIVQMLNGSIRDRGLPMSVDYDRVRDFVVCEMTVSELLLSHGSTKFEINPCEGIGGAGLIRIPCKGFTVEKTKEFIDAISLASNYEIYPRNDGKIMLAITFYGMLKQTGG